MTEAKLRIFSYLPNPRVWKALIAADYCGVAIDVVGDKPSKLADWQWDFDARPLTDEDRAPGNQNARQSKRGFTGTLYKTDDFLKAHPFGTVPAGFSADGEVGIFESNSIMRAVVRASEQANSLYGKSPFEASRIDSFLDATLVFAREAQVYLLALDSMEQSTYARMTAAYEFYFSGIEQALETQSHVASQVLTIADIAFVCDTAQFLRERNYMDKGDSAFDPVCASFKADYERSYRHLRALAEQPHFAKYLGTYLDGL